MICNVSRKLNVCKQLAVAKQHVPPITALLTGSHSNASAATMSSSVITDAEDVNGIVSINSRFIYRISQSLQRAVNASTVHREKSSDHSGNCQRNVTVHENCLVA